MDNVQDPAMGEIWEYNKDNSKNAKRGDQYRVEFVGIMKIENGNWTDCVMYRPIGEDKYFARDTATFVKSFVRMQ